MSPELICLTLDVIRWICVVFGMVCGMFTYLLMEKR
jgi:hypothetical protein